MSTRMRATLITAVFLVLLALAFVILWVGLQGRYLRTEQFRTVRLATSLIAEVSQVPLQDGNILRLAELADKAATGDEVSRVMITDLTGAVVVDSAHSAYDNKPTIVGRAMRGSQTVVETNNDQWTGASAVRNEDGQLLGGVMVQFPTTTLVTAQRNARVVGILLALVGILAGSTLAYFAARLITRPLERLLAGVRQLQAGEIGEPISTTGGPELAEIGRAFNEMANSVLERVRQLELLNQLAANLPLATTLVDIATTIQRSVGDMMRAQSYLWVVDPMSRTLVSVPAAGEVPVGVPISATCDCAVGQAFVSRLVVVAGSGAHDLPAGSSIAEGLVAQSAITLPLANYDTVDGVLVISEPEGRDWIRPEDEALARAIANAAAPVITARLRADTQARAASALQSLLVPEVLPDMGVDMQAVYVPAEEMSGLGGDYYDLLPLDDSRWAIVVGDASGKGLEAARHTATAKYVLRSYILEYGDPAEALKWSNRALAVQETLGRFITLVCGVLDVSSGELIYANAGHLPPLVYRSRTKQVDALEQSGLPLGVVADAAYVDERTTLESGDILCVYTDGITEARGGSEWFGEQRLSETFREHAERPSRDICDRIMQEVRSLAGTKLRDDVVLLVIKMP